MSYPGLNRLAHYPNALSEAEIVERRLQMAKEAADRAARERAAFLSLLAEALRPVIREEIARAMSSKSIGKVDEKAFAKGKLKPVVKQSASQKAAGHKKAARTVKGLQKNRAASKARG